MKVQSIETHDQTDVRMEGADRVKMRMLVGPDDGAPNFHMRHFEIAPGGHTPHHQHDFEHEVLVLTGSGFATSQQGRHAFKAGDVIFVPAGEKHQFVNDTNDTCTFICLIPAQQSCAR